MRILSYFLVVFSCLTAATALYAEELADGYQLVYEEKEAGTSPYQVKFTLNQRYLRIDQPGDASGYIVFDHKQGIVHSVSHQDRTVLQIATTDYTKPDLSSRVELLYFGIPDAPKIDGKDIYRYLAKSKSPARETCMDIKLAAGLLPEVTKVLADYQKVLAGQQSRLLEKTPEEFHTDCFLYDQVYNEGDYYKKGLPVQEWHSNGKSRLLTGYKKLKLNAELFQLPDGYERYSLD